MFIGGKMYANGGCVSSKRRKRDGSVVRDRRGQRERYTRSAISRGEVADWYLFKEQVNSGSWLVTYERKQILQLTTNGTSTTSMNRERGRKRRRGRDRERKEKENI